MHADHSESPPGGRQPAATPSPTASPSPPPPAPPARLRWSLRDVLGWLALLAAGAVALSAIAPDPADACVWIGRVRLGPWCLPVHAGDVSVLILALAVVGVVLLGRRWRPIV